MGNTLRTLGALALLGGLASAASAQDCARIPTSAGRIDQAYAHCARPSGAPPLTADPDDASFGHDAVNGQIVRIAQNTGALTNVAPYAAFFLDGLDFEGDDRATAYGWGTDFGGIYVSVTVDAATGAVTQTGTFPQPQSGQQWTDLTYDYENDTFYAIATDCALSTSLYEVSFQPTATVRLIGTDESGNNTCGIALAADPTTGTLYSYDIILDQFVQINKSTGQSRVVGPIGFDANFAQSMDFDDEDGTLYMYAFNNEAFESELRTVNTSTGNTTLVGRLGFVQIAGGASEGDGSPPPPPTGEVTLDATASTLTVPRGGSIVFDYTVTNGTDEDVTGDLYFRVIQEGQLVAQGLIHDGRTVRAGQSRSGSFTQHVWPLTQAGTYRYYLNIGYFPTFVVDAEVFVITVTPSLLSSAPSEGAGWRVTDVTPWASADEAGPVEATVVASPNPFVGRTSLRFTLEEAAEVRLAVYDLLGREVALLADGALEAGPHEAVFEAGALAAGTYVYRLVVHDEVRTGRLTLAH